MADQDKVQATIKQLVRDWSTEGTDERNACYQPIIDEILNQFPLDYWYGQTKILNYFPIIGPDNLTKYLLQNTII